MAILVPVHNNVKSHARHYFALVSPAICAHSMEIIDFYYLTSYVPVPTCQHLTRCSDCLLLGTSYKVACECMAMFGRSVKARKVWPYISYMQAAIWTKAAVSLIHKGQMAFAASGWIIGHKARRPLLSLSCFVGRQAVRLAQCRWLLRRRRRRRRR